MIDPHVAAVLPAQLLQRLHKRRNVGLCFRIADVDGACTAEYGYPRYTLTLLRACRERPRGSAADKRDELAPSHCLPRSRDTGIVTFQTCAGKAPTYVRFGSQADMCGAKPDV